MIEKYMDQKKSKRNTILNLYPLTLLVQCILAIVGSSIRRCSSNLLEFHGNKVTREYYVNDYGNQIKNFTRSVYMRIREIKYKEKFTIEPDLYPGEYIKDIAKKIIDEDEKKISKNSKMILIFYHKSLLICRWNI